MKTWQIRTAAVAAVVLALGPGVTVAATAAPPFTPPPIAAPADTLDETVAEQLTYLRDEERMSRDLYLAIAELYPDATPFNRIAASEQRHFDSVGRLLTRYGLADPAAGREAGSYADAGLTEMYDQLLTQAKVSVEEAYEAGVAFEVADIADLETYLAGDLPWDVDRLFTNVLAGSNNHLAAYTALRDGKTIGAGSGVGTQNGHGPNRANGTDNPANPQAGTRQERRGGGAQGAGSCAGIQKECDGRGAGSIDDPSNTRPGDVHGHRGGR